MRSCRFVWREKKYILPILSYPSYPSLNGSFVENKNQIRSLKICRPRQSQGMLFKHCFNYYLGDLLSPSLGTTFLPQLYSAAEPKRFQMVLPVKKRQCCSCLVYSTSQRIFKLHYGDLAYWWGCIRKCLRAACKAGLYNTIRGNVKIFPYN